MKLFSLLNSIVDFLGLFWATSSNLHTSDNTKILVTNGRPWFYGVKTEVIDTQNPNFTCSLPDYPIETYTGIGGMVDGMPMSCGGLNGTKIKECFYLQNRTWIQGPSLKQGRYNMGTGSLVYQKYFCYWWKRVLDPGWLLEQLQLNIWIPLIWTKDGWKDWIYQKG